MGKIRLALFANPSPSDRVADSYLICFAPGPFRWVAPPCLLDSRGRDMTTVWAWPEHLVTTAPSVARQDSQDGLVLSLAGEWIVSAGPQLEAAGASLLSLAKDAKRVILDLAGLQRMDTAGAWFIDRAQDELSGAGATVSYRGEQPKHDILIKEAGYHPPEKSTLVHPAHTVALLSAIGETIYDSGVDFFDIVDY